MDIFQGKSNSSSSTQWHCHKKKKSSLEDADTDRAELCPRRD